VGHGDTSLDIDERGALYPGTPDRSLVRKPGYDALADSRMAKFSGLNETFGFANTVAPQVVG